MPSATRNAMISIVVPVLNEAKNIDELYRRTVEAVVSSAPDFEIIFVDDGSQDETASLIAKLHDRDPRVKLISLSRNFGHQLALTAGMDHAIGNAVITMDGDLEHPPEIIPSLIAEWKRGYEIVYTVRQSSWSDAIFSRIFYWLFRRLGNIMLPPNAADFRLMDRKVVDVFLELREKHRFLRGLTSWVGFRSSGINYGTEKTSHRKPRYSFSQRLQLAVDGLLSFSTTPLYYAIYAGFVFCFFGLLELIYVLYVRLYLNIAIPGWASILVALCFVGGSQLAVIGVTGLYIGKIFEEVKSRPLYIVRDRLGFPIK